jgi:hypothetical protein
MIRRVVLQATSASFVFIFGSICMGDPPTIATITPTGVLRGVAADVTINGGNLTGNPELVASIPVTVELPPAPHADAANWKLKLTVPASVPVGVYPVRVKTDDGISNPLLLAVGQVPQVTEAEDNNTFEKAQAVPAPVVVEGQCAGNDVDYFRFPGKKGQRFVVDAQCARIGSGIDPQVRLTTAAGTYVASADDTPGLGIDARLTTALPEDGDYVVEISDTKYQGAARPIYRLQLGEIPVCDEIYPLGGHRGETVSLEVRGGTFPEPRPAAATLTADPSVDFFRLQVNSSALGILAPGAPDLELEMTSTLEVSDLPEIVEPADPAAPPANSAVPVVFNGRIDPAGDEDRFTLPVTAGQVLRIQVSAVVLGSTLDGFLRILGDKDAELGKADDTTIPAVAGKKQKKNAPGILSPDPSIDFTVPANTTQITLALRDLERRGGVGFPYRISVEPVTPSFDVGLSSPQVNLRKGESVVMPVSISRSGYNGPITLNVQDPPAGLTVRPGTVADGQAVGVLTFNTAADAAFGAVTLKVVGTGNGPNGPIVVPAENLVVYASQPSQPAPLPVRFEVQQGLAAAPSQPGPIHFETPETVEMVHGFGGPIPVKVIRKEGQDAAVVVKPYPLPPGVTVADQPIAEKAAEGTINVAFGPEAPFAPFSIALNATGKFGGKDLVVPVPSVTLNVVRPAAVELAAPNVEVKPGATVEVKGKVVRKPALKAPIVVSLADLPAGLKAEPVTVAPEAADFTLNIVADPAAADAMADAKLNIAFKIGDKDYATPPTPLAVKVAK